jgi:hypothetical protein
MNFETIDLKYLEPTKLNNISIIYLNSYLISSKAKIVTSFSVSTPLRSSDYHIFY